MMELDQKEQPRPVAGAVAFNPLHLTRETADVGFHLPSASTGVYVGTAAKRQRRAAIPAWGEAPGGVARHPGGLKARPIRTPEEPITVLDLQHWTTPEGTSQIWRSGSISLFIGTLRNKGGGGYPLYQWIITYG
jgi:hypothetical protein